MTLKVGSPDQTVVMQCSTRIQYQGRIPKRQEYPRNDFITAVRSGAKIALSETKTLEGFRHLTEGESYEYSVDVKFGVREDY